MTTSLIFDFDGVFTENKVHEKLTDICLQEISDLSGVSLDDVNISYLKARRLAHGFANECGWSSTEKEGFAAFADEGPFAKLFGILDMMAYVKGYDEAILSKYKSPADLQYKLYPEAYSEDQIFVNPRSQEIIKELGDHFDRMTVVTNSDPEKVSGIMNSVGANINVRGFAKKYILDPTFDAVPEKMKIGDLFSLDLALPYHLGCEIVMKKNYYNPKWSKKFVRKNGTVIPRLRDLCKLF